MFKERNADIISRRFRFNWKRWIGTTK